MVSMEGIPVVILSHRKQTFLPDAVTSLSRNGSGLGRFLVVDDSGDPEHHQWLDDQGYMFTVVHPTENRGYRQAMQAVFNVAREQRAPYVLLWEEDFRLTRSGNMLDLAQVMEGDGGLAQLNLQRQSVYGVERRWGYMESHQRRGYNLTVRKESDGTQWVKRRTPFTTNPGLIRREILSIDWPSPDVCESTDGGAEVAMSDRLEAKGWHFGWFGAWNTPYTMHVGVNMKTGKGY